MKCLHCQKEGAEHKVKPKLYFGTVSYKVDTFDKWSFCNKQCEQDHWNKLTYDLDCIDERMNVNIHFQRISGSRGTYKGKPADASWNGTEARYFLGDYEFIHRRSTVLTQ